MLYCCYPISVWVCEAYTLNRQTSHTSRAAKCLYLHQVYVSYWHRAGQVCARCLFCLSPDRPNQYAKVYKTYTYTCRVCKMCVVACRTDHRNMTHVTYAAATAQVRWGGTRRRGREELYVFRA